MSSKPTNGINHKQYGVTSEGVAVYLDVGLRETGRHPAQTGRPFTVKLTGGTDGDVAGNMLRIMHERCVSPSLSVFGALPQESSADCACTAP
jgi:glutamate dehydrogenase